MPPKKGYKQSKEHRNKIQSYISLRKGKTLEEIYNKEKAKEIKINQSIGHIGKNHSEEYKLKMSSIMKGKNKGTLEEKHGKEKAKIIKLKMSIKKKNNVPHNKGKTAIESYGVEIAEKLRLAKSERMKGKKSHTKGISWESQLGKKIAKQRKIIWKEKRKNIILPLFDTSIEIKIQNFLKDLEIDFYTHQYRNEIKHGYQCDIFIPIYNLIIECDGNYWHNYPNRRYIDNIRTKELIEKGFKILRLWESEIKNMNLIEFTRILEREGHDVKVIKNESH